VHVSVADWFVIATTVALAATVQGVVGFGGNLLAVPVVALVVPAALPGAMVLPSFPMVVTMAVTERAHVDWRATGSCCSDASRAPRSGSRWSRSPRATCSRW
jgi:uncharacterized membrane protein YfcA